MTKYETALRLIDEAHSQDPTTTTSQNGDQLPYELHYANKMTQYLSQRQPTASEPLRLAIRAQHLKRWEVPRSSYPMTRAGYYAWRGYLGKRQAEIAVQICVESGYSHDEAERVGALVRKEDLRKQDEETQVLEDVACLVFLDDQLEGFEKGLGDEEKVVSILRKTWGKMSEKGRELALGISMSERAKELVGKALS